MFRFGTCSPRLQKLKGLGCFGQTPSGRRLRQSRGLGVSPVAREASKGKTRLFFYLKPSRRCLCKTSPRSLPFLGPPFLIHPVRRTMLAPRGFVTQSLAECPLLDTCLAPHATQSLGPEAHSPGKKDGQRIVLTVGQRLREAQRAQRNTEPRASSQGRLPGGGDA